MDKIIVSRMPMRFMNYESNYTPEIYNINFPRNLQNML